MMNKLGFDRGGVEMNCSLAVTELEILKDGWEEAVGAIRGEGEEVFLQERFEVGRREEHSRKTASVDFRTK